MRFIKIPLTDLTVHIDYWVNYIAMDDNGEWGAFERKPLKSSVANVWRINRVPKGTTRWDRLLITPELATLFDWEQTLFAVEPLLVEQEEHTDAKNSP